MNRILLVFDQIDEIEHVAVNLTRNGFQILKSSSLQEALSKAKDTAPDLIVVTTSDPENEQELFGEQIKMKYFKKAVLPGLIKLEDYLNLQTSEHLVVKSLLQNKTYSDNEFVFLFQRRNILTAANNINLT
ncbi:MAG: hypothetical protein V4608_11445 [Bacteroidota bacterium]